MKSNNNNSRFHGIRRLLSLPQSFALPQFKRSTHQAHGTTVSMPKKHTTLTTATTTTALIHRRRRKNVKQTVDLRRFMHLHFIYNVFLCAVVVFVCQSYEYISHFICNGFHTHSRLLIIIIPFHYFSVCAIHGEQKQQQPTKKKENKHGKWAKMHTEKILPQLSDCGIK